MDPTVTIWCLVYNHGPYLRQCLDGFVMQKTTFVFEALVHDDASTDDSAKIILEYAEKFPGIIKPIIEKTNLYSKHDGSLMRIQSELCKGKYIAFCEGDDYWTDPYKLQKQVDFMESHPDYGLCHTDFDLSDEQKRTHYKEKHPNGDYFPSIITEDSIQIGTVTVLFRRSTFELTPKLYLKHDFVVGDKARWIELAEVSKVKYIPEVTSKYRVLESSASHFGDINQAIRYRKRVWELKRIYAEYYGVEFNKKRDYYEDILKDCYIYRSKKEALTSFKECLRNRSLNLKGLLFFLGTVIPLLHNIIDCIHKPH